MTCHNQFVRRFRAPLSNPELLSLDFHRALSEHLLTSAHLVDCHVTSGFDRGSSYVTVTASGKPARSVTVRPAEMKGEGAVIPFWNGVATALDRAHQDYLMRQLQPLEGIPGLVAANGGQPLKWEWWASDDHRLVWPALAVELHLLADGRLVLTALDLDRPGVRPLLVGLTRKLRALFETLELSRVENHAPAPHPEAEDETHTEKGGELT